MAENPGNKGKSLINKQERREIVLGIDCFRRGGAIRLGCEGRPSPMPLVNLVNSEKIFRNLFHLSQMWNV